MREIFFAVLRVFSFLCRVVSMTYREGSLKGVRGFYEVCKKAY